MTLFEPSMAQGHSIGLNRTHPNHLPSRRAPLVPTEQTRSFRQEIIDSLEEVNAAQRDHEELSVQAIIAPESVEAHDLTIAAAKAQTSLSLTRNVVDRVIQAYRDITNLR